MATKQAVAKILERVTTVQVSGAARFVAAEHLESANIGWTGSNFKRVFLDMVEENVPDGKLAIDRLTQSSKDASILEELGSKAKSFLAHLFGLMEKQSHGEAGDL